MKKILKTYSSSLILLISIIIGAIIGLIFKENTKILTPLGDLFLNLLLISIIPLIFLTITTSIYKMNSPKRLSKILISTIIVFIITSVVSVLLAYITTKNISLIDNNNIILETLDKNTENEEIELNILERTVNAISVNDFNKLLSKDNTLALIIVSLLVGLAMNKNKQKSEKLYQVLESACEVTINFIKIIMYYAPIGLGCYFAVLVGTLGNTIAIGYLKTFIIYTLLCLFVYFIIYSLYAYIANKKEGFKLFWKNILPASITAISTCSSAASMPVNIEYTKKMQVDDDIAETAISLGTTFHKDGSVIGSVFKIMFLVSLFNADISSFKILSVSLLATLLVTAVPIGGGTISEMLIINMLGFPTYTLPILTIIATIIDAPATLLNVVGDAPSAMLINKFVKKTKTKTKVKWNLPCFFQIKNRDY